MDWEQLTKACKEAMKLAAESPGLYGGRYVARSCPKGEFIVLEDDDPDRYNNDESVDIIAHVQPDIVHPIGRARNYLKEDGSVVFN